MPGTHVTTAVELFLVVVWPGTLVTTTVQKFIVKEGSIDGWRDPKVGLKLLKLNMYKFNVHILTSLALCMLCQRCYGFKIWWSWSVDNPISKSLYVGRFLENRAQLQNFAGVGALSINLMSLSKIKSLPGKPIKPKAKEIKQTKHIKQAKKANRAEQANRAKQAK